MATSLPAVPPATPVGLAVIGLGVIGRRMLEQAALVPGLRVRAAWDLDEQACQRAQADFPGTVIAPDAQSLVARADVDVVYVGTPPAFHRQYSLMAAAMGKRVFCEKPLTAHLDDAHRLVAELAEHGTPNAVNFVYASAPSADYLQRRLDAGDLGPVQSIEMRVFFARWPRDWQAGAAPWLAGSAQGGFTREVLSHFVFLSLRLFGPATAERVAIERAPGQAETRLRARLHHAAVTVEIDAAVQGEIADDNAFELVGRQDRAALRRWAHLEHGGHTSDRIDALPLTLDALAALVEGRTDTGLASVDEGLAVVRIIEALLAP